MSTAGYAAFLERMGHRVRQVNGRFWFDSNPRIYGTFPFDEALSAASVDTGAVLGRDGIALRYVCPLGQGRDSYVLAIDGNGYGLDKLTSKARNQTRRGLEQCRAEQVSFKDLARDALALNRDTMLRQGRPLPSGFDDRWRRYYQAAEAADGAEAWCAFHDGALAAYLVAFETGGCCNILIVRSSREHLGAYPNNALLYTYVSAALARPETRRVSIGLEPIQPDMDALDHFKLGLGFEKKPCGQRVELAPWLRPVMKGPILASARQLARLLSRSERTDKLRGLLQWLVEQERTRAGAPGVTR